MIKIKIPGLSNGGGVEDTRFEVKDTKKSEAKAKAALPRTERGQRQECSRPRTKDTNASVFQKKGLQKFFSGDLQKKNDLEKKFSAHL